MSTFASAAGVYSAVGVYPANDTYIDPYPSAPPNTQNSYLILHDSNTDETLSFVLDPSHSMEPNLHISNYGPEDRIEELLELRLSLVMGDLMFSRVLPSSLMYCSEESWMSTVSCYLRGLNTLVSIRKVRANNISNIHSMYSIASDSYVDIGGKAGILKAPLRGVIVIDVVWEPDVVVYGYTKLIPINKIPKRKCYEPIDFYRKYIQMKDRYTAKRHNIIAS